jgi:hypothetical protein
MTESCKVRFLTQSLIIPRCEACPATQNAGFGALAGHEVAGAKHCKTALDLGVHPRAVNDQVPEAKENHRRSHQKLLKKIKTKLRGA